MSWSPQDIDFEKTETDEYVEVRIPRKIQHDITQSDLEFGKITGISSNNPWCAGRGFTEYNPCDAINVDFPIINGKQSIITGYFLRLPLGTFSASKENRVGFIGENEYTKFSISSWSAEASK